MVRVWEEELFQEETKTQAVSKRFPLLFHAGLKFMPQTCKDVSAIKSSLSRPGEMTQQLKAGSALPEDLGSIPTTYLVAINRLFLRDLIPSSSFRGHHVCTWYKHTHTGKALRHVKIMWRFTFPAVVWNNVHTYSLSCFCIPVDFGSPKERWISLSSLPLKLDFPGL